MHAGDPSTPRRQPDLINPSLIDWDRLDDRALLKLALRIQIALQLRSTLHNPDDLLSPVMAARALHCHHRHIYTAIRQGELDAVTRKGKGGRECSQIQWKDLTAWWRRAGRRNS